MSGPWYEEQSPSYEYVMTDIKNSANYPNLNEKIVHEIIKKCVDIEYSKYNSFGSYRGYATFVHGSILKNVKIHIDEYICQVAREKIQKNPILINWVNHILYRPPEDGQNTGLRYEGVKKNFQNTSKR
jgi:hypothetical protein